MTTKEGRQAGLIKLILLIIIGVLILSYFRVDLRNLVEGEWSQRNFAYLWDQIKLGWQVLTDWLNRWFVCTLIKRW